MLVFYKEPLFKIPFFNPSTEEDAQDIKEESGGDAGGTSEGERGEEEIGAVL